MNEIDYPPCWPELSGREKERGTDTSDYTLDLGYQLQTIEF
jgi:hypothetical protein